MRQHIHLFLSYLAETSIQVTYLIAYTVRCRYNAVNFIQNAHKRHTIARPLGRGMVCLLLINTDLYSASIIAVMCAISCYIGPRYNGTWLYIYINIYIYCHLAFWLFRGFEWVASGEKTIAPRFTCSGWFGRWRNTSQYLREGQLHLYFFLLMGLVQQQFEEACFEDRTMFFCCF